VIAYLAFCVERIYRELPRPTMYYYARSHCIDCGKSGYLQSFCYHCMKTRCVQCVNLHMHTHDLSGMDKGCILCNDHCRTQSIQYMFKLSPDPSDPGFPLTCHFEHRRQEPACLLKPNLNYIPSCGNAWKWPWKMTTHDMLVGLDSFFFLVRILCYVGMVSHRKSIILL